MISWEDFEQVDMRVGTVITVEDFPKARKPAWRLTIDFGSDIGIKQSSAQIVQHYSKSSLINKQVIAVVNFPPKQIANFISECLVLGLADNEDKIVLVAPDMKVPNGKKIH